MRLLLLFFTPVLLFAETLPRNPPQLDFSKELTKMLITLAVLILLFIASVFIIKKLMSQKTFKMNSRSDIQIIQKRALSGKTMLYIIEYHGKKIMISESALEVKNLYQKNDPMPTEEFLAIIDEGKKSTKHL